MNDVLAVIQKEMMSYFDEGMYSLNSVVCTRIQLSEIIADYVEIHQSNGYDISKVIIEPTTTDAYGLSVVSNNRTIHSSKILKLI